MNHERNDEHWQRMLDEGPRPSSDDNSSTNPYRLLYEALNEPPQLSIPSDFAARAASLATSATVQRPADPSTERSSWAMLLAASVLPLAVVALVLFYFFPHYFQYLLSYGSMIVFTLLMLVAIQVGDYLLIRRKPMYRVWLGFR